MTLVTELLAIVAPVFLIAGLGFLWGKRGEKFDTEFITRLIGYIGAPCLTFAALAQTTVSPAALGQTAGIMVLCVLAFTLVGALILWALKRPQSVHLPTLLNPNTGNMGLPICLYAFGEQGLALGVAVFATMNVVVFTLNVGIASGSASLSALLKQPVIYSALLGTLIIVTDVPTPQWIVNTTELIGGVTIPLMLLSLGISMAQVRIAHLPQSVLMASLRIGLGFTLSWVITGLFALDPLVRSVIILQSSMPSAVFAYLFAQIYDRRPAEVASTILVSTIMSIVTIPLVLWVLL